MEQRDLADLLYTALSRFTTIQVSWRYGYDAEMMRAAEQRWVRMNPPGSVSMLTSALGGESREANVEVQRRLWWQKPDCWREEHRMMPHGSSTTILCNGQWWAGNLESGIVYTNAAPDERWSQRGMRVERGSPPDLEQLVMGVPFLDPSFLLASHNLEVAGTDVHAGREAVRVRATYRKRKEFIHEAFFWASADGYDLLVDREYGILLRYAARLNGEEFAVSSVEQVVFDEPVPAKVFTFTPP